MKAYITAEFSPQALKRLEAILQDEIIYESWRSTNNLYFNDQDLLQKLQDTEAEIYICEGDNVKFQFKNNWIYSR
jgi:hypothetical protein